MTNDLRIDLVRRVQLQHMLSYAGVKTEHRAEEWRCKCGADFKGDGAIEKGRRHEAGEILTALDEAAVVA
jgi:hypothetical protein